jgi:hypothetical protein
VSLDRFPQILAHLFAPALRPAFAVARWVFARLLGAVFFCAFGSLALQIRGLAGEHGIMPAHRWLDAVWNQFGATALWQVPTLCWLGAGDGMLLALCLAGVALAVVLLWGEWFPGPCALVLWALYLSLCSVVDPFLNFQWDALLLEVALLAAAYLPWSRRPNWARATFVSEAARLLLWWLLFRLMFESGAVKLASGDPAWASFTALDYHFETQPLPLWTAWFVHQLPEWLLCLATFVMFAIEFLAPLLLLAPRRWRHGAAWALIALQVAILTTGNYAYFNWLTIALCLLLFDDAAWPARLRSRISSAVKIEGVAPWARRTTLGVAGLVVFITIQPLLSSVGLVKKWPAPLAALPSAVAQFRSFNGYGLFAVMTTERREIVVEGSNDGVNWRTYEFRWKPGDLGQRPRLVAPHQPRLDWQMWFAALGSLRQNPWFAEFLIRLLQGSPEVVALLSENPFPDQPPRFVRATFYDYHFTKFGESGWWRREPLGLYCPPITLQDGKPVFAR